MRTTLPIPYTTVRSDLAAYCVSAGTLTADLRPVYADTVQPERVDSKAVTVRMEVCRG